jgi:hypothetical protein
MTVASEIVVATVLAENSPELFTCAIVFAEIGSISATLLVRMPRNTPTAM